MKRNLEYPIIRAAKQIVQKEGILDAGSLAQGSITGAHIAHGVITPEHMAVVEEVASTGAIEAKLHALIRDSRAGTNLSVGTALTVIELDTPVLDPAGVYSSGSFVVPEEGTWSLRFQYSGSRAANNAGNHHFNRLFKNGSDTGFFSQGGGNYYTFVGSLWGNFDHYTQCAAGDTLEIRSVANANTTNFDYGTMNLSLWKVGI